MLNWSKYTLTGRYAKQHRKADWVEVFKSGALMLIDISIVFAITFVLYTGKNFTLMDLKIGF